jgi:2-keto-4-pentenoate hydratase
LSDAETTTHAQTLARARATGMPMPAVEIPDESEAYALQAAAIAALGQPLIGWKIGATATVTQQALRLQRPFWGPMPEPDAHASGAVLPFVAGTRGVECELAFRLNGDLPRRVSAYGREEIEAAICAMHIAIEVVGARMQSAAPLHGFQAIADFGFNGAFVLGPEVAGWRELDLPAVAARCLINGEERARGTAKVVLGNPLDALAWLADHGPGLRSGELISTGTLTGLLPVATGDHIVGDFGRLGQVELRFA